MLGLDQSFPRKSWMWGWKAESQKMDWEMWPTSRKWKLNQAFTTPLALILFIIHLLLFILNLFLFIINLFFFIIHLFFFIIQLFFFFFFWIPHNNVNPFLKIIPFIHISTKFLQHLFTVANSCFSLLFLPISSITFRGVPSFYFPPVNQTFLSAALNNQLPPAPKLCGLVGWGWFFFI